MYGDHISQAMKACIDETARRRKVQDEYNKAHGIVPKTIVKPIREIARAVEEYHGENNVRDPKAMTTAELRETIRDVEKNMKEAAKQLDFERAAELRDVLFELRAGLRA
jgi:excinuclease ABC subunit B